jgi:glycosyltransferase involved in cell wall biosynthesis
VRILFNPVDFSAAEFNQPAMRPAVPTITMIAQWRAQKDHATAIRAAAILRQRGVIAHWQLVGEEDPSLTSAARALIADEHLGDTVSIMGRRTDARALLMASTVAVLATHFEGLPVSVVEYAAARLPIVISRVEGTDYLISPEDGVIGVPHADPVALADQVQALLMDEERARALGARAHAKFYSLADTRHVLASLETIYREAVTSAGTGI